MKKFLCLIFICITSQAGFCSPQTSLNLFEIPINAVPPGGVDSSNKLSNGAVTAITLGSIFGGLGAIGGIGWYFAKHAPGLACGCACGIDTPLVPVFFDDICKDFSQNKYLEKAFGYIKKSSDKKYLIIPDSEIKEKTYNTIIFEIPENMTEFRIIQSADGKINSKIIISGTEVSMKKDVKNGLQISQGRLPGTEDKFAALVVENYTTEKIYAIIIEFSKSYN